MAATQVNYWTHDLSPFIFQVQSLNFAWLTSWWGIPLLILLFGGGFAAVFQAKQKPFLFLNTPFKIEILQTALIYSALILALLFGAKNMGIHWGLRWYSMMYLMGFLVVYLGCLYQIKKGYFRITEAMLSNLITASVVGMLIGARLGYVFIYDFASYSKRPWDIFATWEGGLSFHGGIVGVSCAVFFFCRYYKVPFLHVTDKLALYVPIGIFLGRIGNFINGELWGRMIDSPVPWAVIFSESGGGPIPRHPSQLYQAICEGLLLFTTLQVLSKFTKKDGVISCYFVIFYGIYRFFMEFFREADPQISYFFLGSFSWGHRHAFTPWWTMLTMGQLLCLLTSCVGLLVLPFLLRRSESFGILSKQQNRGHS